MILLRKRKHDLIFSQKENEAPDIRVKFGKETLDIDSWGCKHQYDSFCQVSHFAMTIIHFLTFTLFAVARIRYELASSPERST